MNTNDRTSPFLSLIIQLLILLTAYNTLFSISKTVLESRIVCAYSRPGMMISTAPFQTVEINNAVTGGLENKFRAKYVDNKEKCGNSRMIYKEEHLSKDGRTGEEGYGVLRCQSSSFTNFGKETMNRTMYILNPNYNNDEFNYIELAVMLNSSQTLCFAECQRDSTQVNCDLKSDFYSYSVFVISIIIISYVLIFTLSMKNDNLFNLNVRRFMFIFFKSLGMETFYSSYINCNERTLSGTKFIRGDNYITLERNNRTEAEERTANNTEGLLTDDIFVIRGKVIKIQNCVVTVMYIETDKKYFLKTISKFNSDALIKYLKQFNLDNKARVLTEVNGVYHSLSVEEIIKEMSDNNKIMVCREVDKSFTSFLPKYGEIDEYFIGRFFSPKVQDDDISKFVEHNKMFFKETEGNFNCLFLLLSNKTFWFNKPIRLGHRRWTRYISEGRILAEKLGVELSTQKDYKENKGREKKVEDSIQNILDEIKDEENNHNKVKKEKVEKDNISGMNVGLDLINVEQVKTVVQYRSDEEIKELEAELYEPLFGEYFSSVKNYFAVLNRSKNVSKRFRFSIAEFRRLFEEAKGKENKVSEFLDKIKVNLSLFKFPITISDENETIIMKILYNKQISKVITKSRSKVENIAKIHDVDTYLKSFHSYEKPALDEKKLGKIKEVIKSKSFKILNQIYNNSSKNDKKGGKSRRKKKENKANKLKRFLINNEVSMTGIIKIAYNKITSSNKESISANRILKEPHCKSGDNKKITTNYFIKEITKKLEKEMEDKSIIVVSPEERRHMDLKKEYMLIYNSIKTFYDKKEKDRKGKLIDEITRSMLGFELSVEDFENDIDFYRSEGMFY